MVLVNRKNGTSGFRHGGPGVTYRELLPRPQLRGHVRAYFSFIPGAVSWRGTHAVLREVFIARDEPFCSPVFADGHASLVIDLGASCEQEKGWTFGTPVGAHLIGALRTVASPAGNTRAKMLGAYFQAASTLDLTQVPAIELTDRILSLEHLWGSEGARLAEDLAELDEVERVERLESALLERIHRARPARSAVDVAGLARWACAEPNLMTVSRLADAAGVSRRHLSRVFRQVVGVSPKRYCRLARFHAGLAYAGAGAGVKWARLAPELGYADQSHMIAEFRELSSLTPESLATQQWFHPFILEARSRLTGPR